MKPSSDPQRKAAARRAKILKILQAGPKTANEIRDLLNSCRFEDYGNWTSHEVRHALGQMMKYQKVEVAGYQGKLKVYKQKKRMEGEG